MSDIKTIFIDWAHGTDYQPDGLGLQIDEGLETAVIISLFTDRRALDDDLLPDHHQDKRGWWGDSFAELNQDLIGSRLWLLGREKQLATVLVRAKEYAEESLKWLIDDQVAEQVTVVASNPREGVLALLVKIYRPEHPVAQYQFNAFWSA